MHRKPSDQLNIQPCTNVNLEENTFCDYVEFRNHKDQPTEKLDMQSSNKFNFEMVEFWQDILNDNVN